MQARQHLMHMCVVALFADNSDTTFEADPTVLLIVTKVFAVRMFRTFTLNFVAIHPYNFS